MSNCRSVVVLLFLLCSSMQNAICISSECVSGLPQSIEELVSQVKRSPLPNLIRLIGQLRLFPNITFTCSGSIVGWSMIATNTSVTGGRPTLQTWNSSDGENFQQSAQRLRLTPCLKEVISSDDQLYLYENTTETLLEFRRDDILGMLLRDESIGIFHPYFIAVKTFVAFHRQTRSSRQTENLKSFMQDDMMPLLFLHICSREADNYDVCLEEYRRRPTCLSHMATSSSIPSATNDSRDNDSEEASDMIVIISATLPLCLGLLTLTVVLLLIILYVRLSRKKKKRRKERTRETNTTAGVSDIEIDQSEPIEYENVTRQNSTASSAIYAEVLQGTANTRADTELETIVYDYANTTGHGGNEMIVTVSNEAYGLSCNNPEYDNIYY